MITSLITNDITNLVSAQLRHFFPDGNPLDDILIKKAVRGSLERLEFCFENISSNYYRLEGKTYFNHLHTDHWCSFLWFLSNQLHNLCNDHRDAVKIFALNKALHGIDAFYSIQLPDVFLLVHPIGTILGKAQYDDYLVVYQNVTVGGSIELDYPVIGKSVALMAKSTVLGSCVINEEVWLSSNSLIQNTLIESNSMVFGSYPNQIIKTSKRSVFNSFFSNKPI